MASHLVRLPRHLSRRAFTTSTRRPSTFKSGPAPPRLPKEDQALFEKLQKQSAGAFSQPRADVAPSSRPNIRMQINQSPDSLATTPAAQPSRPSINQSPHSDEGVESEGEVKLDNGKAIKKGDEFHPNMRRGAPPEFEGDVNPKTGEVGGPKNEPLRWGGNVDWSYNGRVTDF
ncbi:DUF1674-domain-containing protein [Ophiobolus disseminans]|uniref:Succinate dehydrogenase assembly factor 4, mitochondrial n=1 Tax=Ophiobolus disseminans TaxID=1469910 RepID=A0A6A7AA16_9PLEO|nr:DUF1674-domain-containing protein [Ophiobolus disseminans]